jgi:dienelactone hydrolase
MLFPVTIGWLVTATGTWNAVLAAFVVLMAVDAVLWAMLDPRGSFPQAVSRRPGVAAVMLAGFIGLLVASPAEAQAPSGPVTPAERAAIRERVAVLERRLAERETAGLDPDLAADARLYLEAVQRVVDYEPVLDAGGRGQLEAALQAGEARIADLEAGRQPWITAAGRSIRGFRSGIDGSTQPFVAIVPPDRNPTVPTRLDVNLHGSLARRSAIGVLDFILGGGGGGGPDFIEIQPLGRLGENAFRFEGETDVFEAIEAACRRFPVDRRRLVLRGTSLGGVAAWQIGLKRPDRFAAVGPAAGPVDTRLFSAAPWPHFIPLEPLTPWQEKTLHLVDAIDYAANAGMVPVVAAMGQQDPYFPSHGQIEKAIAAEGAAFTGLVAAGAGHGLDGGTVATQLRLLGEQAAAGIPARPPRVRFVTWTLKFSRCHWVELLGLDAHYERAEIDASLAADGSVAVTKLANVSRFAIHPPALAVTAAGRPEPTLTIRGEAVALPPRAGDAPRSLAFALEGDRWRCLGELASSTLSGKRPGLQGPIDDAFATAFLCVRGTGEPAHEAVGRWAEANLRRFAWEWGFHYRGTLPVKDDTDVTAEDLRDRHLVLFGDPGSNRWIRELLPQLPVRWSADAVQVGQESFSAADHALALIAPNPLPAAAGRYVVFNSGHT